VILHEHFLFPVELIYIIHLGIINYMEPHPGLVLGNNRVLRTVGPTDLVDIHLEASLVPFVLLGVPGTL
jgi:hypothetical protein